jgi:hypothetical protein
MLITCKACNTPKSPLDYYPSRPSKCKACIQAVGKQWHLKNRSRRTLQMRARIYGITLEQATEMVKHGCDICGRFEQAYDGRGKMASLHIDHCHATGKVRGTLCAACNRLVAYGRDDIGILRAAIAYLERSNTRYAEEASVR